MKQQAFRFPSPARPVLPLCTHHCPQPAAAAGTGCSSGSQKARAAPRVNSGLEDTQKAPLRGKKRKDRGSGRRGRGRLWRARPDPGAGKMTSAVKVEEVPLPPRPTSKHLCPPAWNSGAQCPGKARGGLKTQGRRGPPSLCDAGGVRGGFVELPGRAQVSSEAPPAGGKGFDPGHSPASRPQLPKRPPESRQGLAGLPSLSDPDPTPRAPRPSSFH